MNHFPSSRFSNGFTVAIDGPVGSGKGTVAKGLVDKLNAVTFYTGGMYRALALKCLRENISFDDKGKIDMLIKSTNIEICEKIKNNYSKVILDGEDVTNEIISPEIAQGSSQVSQIKEVRDIMVKKQREMALKAKGKGQIVVMEGRDVGIRVLKDADLKIFLTADVVIRAKRRLNQYRENGIEKSLEDVIMETKKRDMQDSTREIDPLPLKPVEKGYVIVDNSKQKVSETVDKIISIIEAGIKN